MDVKYLPKSGYECQKWGVGDGFSLFLGSSLQAGILFFQLKRSEVVKAVHIQTSPARLACYHQFLQLALLGTALPGVTP